MTSNNGVGIQMDVASPQGIRRLPIYLLLDCSGSMGGEPIEAVQRGVEAFVHEVNEDEFARDTVHVGVITFGRVLEGDQDGASLITAGLVPIKHFTPPNLRADGLTPLGAAFRELNKSIDKDVIPSIPGKPKGDWKPLVFVLTDGAPNDEWEAPRQQLLDRESKKLVNVITVGCGRDIDRDTLREISVGDTYVLDEKDDSYFSPFFKWMSSTVGRVASVLSSPGDDTRHVDLPPAPPKVKQLSF
ncbi:VWA domain-containing protein [Streptomyces sp. NPDC050759]|uniref:vWA domain-containing protein n=1 Tax=Streptomyces sp. NPDC050759 TaxID=3365635 RepID=UPI00378ECE44